MQIEREATAQTYQGVSEDTATPKVKIRFKSRRVHHRVSESKICPRLQQWGQSNNWNTSVWLFFSTPNYKALESKITEPQRKRSGRQGKVQHQEKKKKADQILEHHVKRRQELQVNRGAHARIDAHSMTNWTADGHGPSKQRDRDHVTNLSGASP